MHNVGDGEIMEFDIVKRQKRYRSFKCNWAVPVLNVTEEYQCKAVAMLPIDAGSTDSVFSLPQLSRQ